MPHEMSVRIPPERGEQLREFARVKSLGIGEAIGSLLDHAVATGLVHELPMPDIEVTTAGDDVCLQVGGIRVSLSIARAKSVADSLQKVATTPGAAILDLDGPYIIELCRQGRAVVLSIANSDDKHKTTYGKHGLFARTFACDVARALAGMITAAAERAETESDRRAAMLDRKPSDDDQETVEALLGDLDLTADDATDVVLDERDTAAIDAAIASVSQAE